jgi:pimeloyl-ACP methyl ester carboxylesterase
MAVPYQGAFPTSFITNPAQQRRSWYIFFFQMPWAETAVAHDNFAFIERLWQEWSPGWHYPPETIAAVKETLRQPGVLTAALSYYRHSFNAAHHSPALAYIRARRGEAIDVPALYLHGREDGGIGAEVTEGMEASFSRGLKKYIIPGAGHFVHQEKPAEVNRLLLAFLEKE